MKRRRRRQKGKGLGSVLAGFATKLVRPLMSKVLAKGAAKAAAKALAEGTVSAGAEYGMNKLLKRGRGKYKSGLFPPAGPRINRLHHPFSQRTVREFGDKWNRKMLQVK